jgi:hypothetical protein
MGKGLVEVHNVVLYREEKLVANNLNNRLHNRLNFTVIARVAFLGLSTHTCHNSRNVQSEA